MKQHLLNLITEATGAETVISQQLIQSLWSGYGEILKVELSGDGPPSLILKAVTIPNKKNHPRGWNTDRSHNRKVRSYQVEIAWYRDWSERCGELCRVANCYSSVSGGQECVILLEDLDAAGFPKRKSHLNKAEVKLCLRWLANFHATFMGDKPSGLWRTGSYWHLATRPDELAAMQDKALQQAAVKIDAVLSACQYKTIIHGDAKLANFCFSWNGKQVAAVDFQYVGGGCGMKDVVYFLSSCLSEGECARWESELLDYYFSALSEALALQNKGIDGDAVKAEWLPLFAMAWTDFHRFLLGWMSTHHKINAYSQRLASKALAELR